MLLLCECNLNFTGLIPREDLAGDHVLAVLSPFSKENGGPLEIEVRIIECNMITCSQRITFVEGRGNIIVRYPGTASATTSFVGSHMDVVPADPAGWDRNPFKLEIDGDLLYGRGTTDCLGHVALLTDFFATLAQERYVFICDHVPSSPTSSAALFLSAP